MLPRGLMTLPSGRLVYSTGKVLIGLMRTPPALAHSADAERIQETLLSDHDYPLTTDQGDDHA